MSDYHIPVLLNDVVVGLSIVPGGTYVDVTYGGGGHSKAILDQLGEGRLFAFDQDLDATGNTLEDPRLVFVQQNFRHVKSALRLHGVTQVDGLLADLGVSSHQFDVAERGFSYRYDGPLDMRMNQNASQTAAEILNTYDRDELAALLRTYGELRIAGKLAYRIGQRREDQPFTTTGDFVSWFEGSFPSYKANKELSKVFQALRIEVNGELDALKEMLEACESIIKPGGRLVVISYHSLEDRLVKNYIKKGVFEGEVEKDFYGNVIRPFREVNRKVIVPETKEIEENSRARSAKLRIGEKL